MYIYIYIGVYKHSFEMQMCKSIKRMDKFSYYLREKLTCIPRNI